MLWHGRGGKSRPLAKISCQAPKLPIVAVVVANQVRQWRNGWVKEDSEPLSPGMTTASSPVPDVLHHQRYSSPDQMTIHPTNLLGIIHLLLPDRITDPHARDQDQRVLTVISEVLLLCLLVSFVHPRRDTSQYKKRRGLHPHYHRTLCLAVYQTIPTGFPDPNHLHLIQYKPFHLRSLMSPRITSKAEELYLVRQSHNMWVQEEEILLQCPTVNHLNPHIRIKSTLAMGETIM